MQITDIEAFANRLRDSGDLEGYRIVTVLGDLAKDLYIAEDRYKAMREILNDQHLLAREHEHVTTVVLTEALQRELAAIGYICDIDGAHRVRNGKVKADVLNHGEAAV